MRNAPILPTNPNEVYQAIYTDAQEPPGFISALQRALVARDMVGSDGAVLVADGLYGPRTAFALRSWMLQHPARWPRFDLLRLTGDTSDRVRVADVGAYFSLGLDVESVVPVRGVTPGAIFIERALERGEVDLSLDLRLLQARSLIPRMMNDYQVHIVDLTVARSNVPLIDTSRNAPFRGSALTVLRAGGAPWQIRLNNPYADPFTSDVLRDGAQLPIETTCVYFTNEAAPAGTAPVWLVFEGSY